MNEEVKQKWVEALLSGKYKQVAGKLSDGTGFCCLGVLCELAVKEGVIEPSTHIFPGRRMYSGETNLLPRSVANWAGISRDPVAEPKLWVLSTVKLSKMNDRGMDFRQIAQVMQDREIK